MFFFSLVCAYSVGVCVCICVCVCVCVDLRSVLLLSVKSRSGRLCPGLEEERGGLSLSSVVSSEKRTKETTTLPMMLSKIKWYMLAQAQKEIKTSRGLSDIR